MARFLEEGSLVLQYFPSFQGVIGYRILGQTNRGLEYWAYGPIPQSFADASGVIHEVGVVPALFTNTSPFSLPNPLPGVSGTLATDLFYNLNPGQLYHIFIDFQNSLLRVYPTIPFNQIVVGLYGTTETPPADIGWSSGEQEFLVGPQTRVGFFVTNLTNRNLRTNIVINLANYQTAIITDPALLYQMVTRSGDGRYTKFINLGGPQWTSDLSMFSAIGFSKPVPVMEIIKSKGQAVSRYFTSPQSGVTYE